MRVITGLAKGKRLITAEGMEVRPTPEKVKEGIFSSIQFDVEGRRVLDLFSGSGQLGIEALSRGAEFGFFADISPVSIKNITKNLENTGLLDKAKVVRGDYSAVLAGLNEKFDYVFLDPPYAAGLLFPALKKVQRVVSDYGVIICEHPSEHELPEVVDEFRVTKVLKYGKICVSFYRRGDNDE